MKASAGWAWIHVKRVYTRSRRLRWGAAGVWGGKASVPSCFQFELKLRRGRARLSELLDVPGPVQIAAFGAEIIGEDLEVLVQDVEHRGLSLLLLAYQPRNQMPFSCTDCSFL